MSDEKKSPTAAELRALDNYHHPDGTFIPEGIAPSILAIRKRRIACLEAIESGDPAAIKSFQNALPRHGDDQYTFSVVDLAIMCNRALNPPADSPEPRRS